MKIYTQRLASEKPSKTGQYIYSWKHTGDMDISEMGKAWYFCEEVGMNSIGWATNVADEIEWWLEEIEQKERMVSDVDFVEPATFKNELRGLINKYSKESGSDTPDFILASYVVEQLEVFDSVMRARENYYGRKMKDEE